MEQEKNLFVQVPHSLVNSTYVKERRDKKTGEVQREEKRLTCEHRLLLAMIVILSTNKPCSASNRFLADYIGVQERQIKNLIGDLSRSGYIKIEGRTCSRLIYQTEKTYRLWQAIKRRDVSLTRATDCPSNQDTRATDCPNDDGLGQSISKLGQSISKTRAINCPQSIRVVKKEYIGATQNTKRSRKKKEFVSPSLDEVEQYVKENGLVIDAKDFFNFYTANEKGGRWYDSNDKLVKSWKQKARTWDMQERKKQKVKPPASGPFVPTQESIDKRNQENAAQLKANHEEMLRRMEQEGMI